MSEDSKVNRRNFLKIGGLAAMTLPAVEVVGSTGDEEIVASEETYGKHLVRRPSNGHRSERLGIDQMFRTMTV